MAIIHYLRVADSPADPDYDVLVWEEAGRHHWRLVEVRGDSEWPLASGEAATEAGALADADATVGQLRTTLD
jgi:hypothetical protein